MKLRLKARGLIPVVAVAAIVGLAFFAPAKGSFNGILASLGYPSYAGPWTSGPASSYQSACCNRYIFIDGAGGAVYAINFDGATFSGATNLGGISTADPGGAANLTTGKVYVFVRGTDGQAYYKLHVASWGPWVAFGGRLIGGPEVSVRDGNPGVFDVWVRGS